MLKIMTAHNPIKLVHHSPAAYKFKKAGCVTDDIYVFYIRNSGLWDTPPSRLLPQEVCGKEINDEGLKPILLWGYGIVPWANFDATGAWEHSLSQSLEAVHRTSANSHF